MKQIIVVGEPGKFNKFFEYFEDFPGKVQFFEHSEFISLKANHVDDYVFIGFGDKPEDYKINYFLENLQNVHLLIDSKNDSIDALKHMKNWCQSNFWVSGFVDISLDPEFYLPFFQKLIIDTSGGTEELQNISDSVDELISSTKGQLAKIKSIYEEVVPKRSQDIKGVSFLSKYNVGEKPGGEFFEVIARNNKLLFFLSSSSSYVSSSLILSYFNYLQQEKNINLENLEKFLANLSTEVGDLIKDEGNEIQLLLFIVDMGSLELKGYNFGQSVIVRKNETYSVDEVRLNSEGMKKAFFSFKLERGEKFVVLSPGLMKNFELNRPKEKTIEFVREQFKLRPIELLDEIFFHLKRGRDSMFLTYDGSGVCFDIDENVIMEI